MSLEQTIRKLGAKGVSQPLEKDMNDQVHAGSYSSKHFEVSAPAQKLYAALPKEVNPDDAEKSVQLHDKLFAIHKKTSASERSTDADVKDAQRLHDEIMKIAKDMGLEDKHGHVKASLEHIKKYVDTQVDPKDEVTPEDVAKRFATPSKEYQTDVKADADIDNIAKFKITRDKKGQRKLKIIDDEYNLGATKMDRIEKVSPSFLEALKQVQENEIDIVEKKKMTKADIAALKEPKGSIDAKDLAALRAGEHKKKVEEGMKKEEIELEEAKATHNYTPKGVECPVCGMEACPPKPSTNEEVALQTFAEAVRSIARASRTWADKKTSTDIAKKHSKKGYTPPGTPSKAEMRAKGAEALKAFLAKGGKIRKEEVEEFDEGVGVRNQVRKAILVGAKSAKSDAEHEINKNIITKLTGNKETAKTYGTARKMVANEEVEELDEAQFIVIQKGMNQKRIRNNPAEIMQARKDGWAIREEVETVDEANELKNLAKSQAAATVKREVGQKKAMFAKKDAVDKQKFSKSMQSIKAGDEVEVDGEQIDEAALSPAHISAITNHVKKMWGKGKISFDKQDGKHFVSHSDGIQTHVHSIDMKKGVPHVTHFMSMDEEVDKKTAFMERAIAILGEEFAELSFDELVEEVKKARGRPRKNPLPDPNAPKRPRGRPKKGSSPTATAKPSEAKPADTDKDREHIVMGLRKAVSLRGEHGVKFADGSTHKISAEHAQKALKMHDSLSKPSEKMTFARKLAASHDSFKRALSDKNPGSEETKKTGITLAKRAD